MEWREEFQHGVIWQDFQHRQLLDNINVLVDSVTSGKNDPVAFRKTAHFVIQYCNGHFKIEEEYMKRHGYSLMEVHVKQHNTFINDFNGILKEKELNDAEKSSVLLHKLLGWYGDHIMTSDKLLANFLLKHGIK